MDIFEPANPGRLIFPVALGINAPVIILAPKVACVDGCISTLKGIKRELLTLVVGGIADRDIGNRQAKFHLPVIPLGASD